MCSSQRVAFLTLLLLGWSLAAAEATPRRRSVRVPSLPAGTSPCPGSIATPIFDTVPLSVGDFVAFRPLGFLSVPIHMFPAKHSAFSMTLPGATPVPKAFRSPARARVTEIWEASFSTGGANYQVYLYPCAEMRVYVGHLRTLSAKLLAAFRGGTPVCNTFQDASATVTTCRRNGLTITVESGEEIGTGPDTAGIDLGVVDFRRPPAAFVVPAHYDFYYPYWSAPLDYFTPEARAVIAAKTGHVFGSAVRTADPVGGTHMQDLAGTAQGNWFLTGRYHANSTDLTPFLSLVHDYVVPSQPIAAIGTSVAGLSMGLYAFTPASSGSANRDFAMVIPDGRTYCYDAFLGGQSPGGMPLTKPNGLILMSMPTQTTLRVEFVAGSTCGSGPWTMTPAATEFVR